MNFATLKGLTIPEGNVTQITDASGRVLWKQAPSGAKVSIVASGDFGARVVIDGITYGTASTELTVPIGTVITCKADQVRVGGNQVGATTYDYTVTGDVAVNCTGTQVNPYYKLSIVQITEQ